MHLLRKILFGPIIIITVIIFYSCGASHSIAERVIYKDTSFTYNSLKKNEVAIGGIASQQLTLTDNERFKYSSQFSTMMIEELKDVESINIINTTQLIQQIGRENYFDIMKEFDVEQKLIAEAMVFIKEEIPEIDYIIIANIENENIIDRSDSYKVRDEEGEVKNRTDYQKRYYITVEFLIYDFSQLEMILNILMYNKAQRSESRTTETGCVESCITSAIQFVLFGSPAEISRREVLAEIFKKFAARLAKQ